MSTPPHNSSLFHHNQGDFNFPPADTTDSALAAVGDLTVRFSDLRRHFQLEGEEFRRDAAAVRARILARAAPMSSRSLRRTVSSRNMRFNESSESDRPSTLPPPLMPANRHSTMSLSRGRRRPGGLRRLREEQRELERPDPYLQDRSHRLGQIGSELQDTDRTLQASDPEYLRRRAFKRVKTEHPRPEAAPIGFHTFRYGQRGQVLPGNLRMEIESYDGGYYHSPPEGSPMHDTTRPYPYENQSRTFLPENVLTDDDSVYCTTKGCCNLMLRHVGGSSFTVDKLIIRAPVHGYTAPVQQGLVFIGYDQDELLQRTKAYHIKYPASQGVRPPSLQPSSASLIPRDTERPASQPRSAHDSEQISLLESLHDDTMWQNHQLRERIRQQMDDWRRHANVAHELTHYFNASDSQSAAQTANADDEDADDLADPFDAVALDTCDWPPLSPVRATNLDSYHPTRYSDMLNATLLDLASTSGIVNHPRISTTLSATYPPFYEPEPLAELWDNITDKEHDEIDDPPTRTASTMRPNPVNDYLFSHHHHRSRQFRSAMRSRRMTPGTIEPRIDTQLHNHNLTDTLSGGDSSSANLLTPNAKFFIGRDQDQLVLNFNPPVSGRFILLKLFSPVAAPDVGNIDIQYVGVNGFAGPRFFPSLEYTDGLIGMDSSCRDEDAVGDDRLFD